MKATTRLTWLDKIQNGLIFEEDFEANNFIDNENWQTLQGIAEHTKEQAVAGKYSLLLADTQDDSNLPVVIKNDLRAITPDTNTQADMYHTMTVWFYDDATEQSLEGPFLKVELRNSRFLEVGVRNMVDSNHYSVTNTPTSEDSFIASSISRTTGWHKFQIANTGPGGSNTGFNIFIDGTFIRNYTVPMTSLQMNFVSLQAAVVGNQTNSFGFFDELKYNRHNQFRIYGVNGRRLELSGGLGTTDFATTDNYGDFQATVNPVPNAYDINISQKLFDDTNAAYTDLGMLRYDVDFQNGDIWAIQEIDFGRRAYPYQDNPTTNGANNESPNGTTETITVGRKEKLNFSIKALDGQEWFARNQNFFDYSRKGFPFAFALESHQTAFTTLVSANVGDSFLFVDPMLGDAYANIKAGSWYALEDVNRTVRQVVKVSSLDMTAGKINLDQPLNYTFAAGDFLRAINYWPFAETDVPRNNGLLLAEPKTLRYDWMFNLREYVI